ncbi:MAG: ABC transporter permease subunit [Pseudohongiellaceae bacterium]
MTHSSTLTQPAVRSIHDSPQSPLRRRLRKFYDRTAGISIAIGGLGVIVAILLIFLYLLYEVMPLFEGAAVEPVAEYRISSGADGSLLHLAIEEQSQLGMRLDSLGELTFFTIDDGETVLRAGVVLPEGATISSFALDSEETGIFALGLDTGEVMVAAYDYNVSFAADNSRIITPSIDYPFEANSYPLLAGEAVTTLAVSSQGDNLIIAAADAAGQVNLTRVSRQTNLMSAFNPDEGEGGEFTVESARMPLPYPDLMRLFLSYDQRWLYSISESGRLTFVDIRGAFRGEVPAIEDEALLVESGAQITDVAFLLGGISLMVSDDNGVVSQWFAVRGEGRFSVERIREFRSEGNVVIDLTSEQRRKNFVTLDESGNVGIYNTTAHREVFNARLANRSAHTLAISPRGDALLIAEGDGNISAWAVHNDHPEVSWSALWGKVWYESYDEPAYIWQSSAANNDFEPKYSLMPLSFGTLKAAFYAMLLATPLAICGAIFTGYFMAPAMRRKVKPLIELMEALPTVVLGFLAGLWLAPFIEANLLGVFSLLVIMPVSILAASFLWFQLPKSLRYLIPDGWEAAILLPVIVIAGFLTFAFAVPVENWLFGGDMRGWITNELGITYDQRNALVVGFAMGFAVIPTIFSIAEDAIFTVPKHLTYGSLALGATPWQSLFRVVLPTASPGIFSGLMIGLGRAVGETMIVLMATGNTPIMDVNIFEGMRTLAANIAVEVPESEVDSTHYRVLFLAALVLFMFTFVVNTIAEIVRQRLRRKYSTV